MDNIDETCGCENRGGEESCCSNNEAHSCGCGHGHDHDHETVTLTLDDDSELECSILGTFDVEDKEYIALLPIGDDEVIIYHYGQDGDDISLGLIETDEEFKVVSEAFQAIFVDEDEEEVDIK